MFTIVSSRVCRWLPVALLILVAPGSGLAQMTPHRAEYLLRLGVAANAPRIGTAIQEITADCKNWHIKRDVLSEISFTPSLKVSFASKLEGDESIDGRSFRYRSVEALNGAEHSTDGKVQNVDGELHADLVTPDGATRVVLPLPTLMPVTAINFLIARLRDGTATFHKPVFGAERSGEAFSLDVDQLAPDSIRAAPPALKSVKVPTERFWSISAIGRRMPEKAGKPLFSLRAKIFESGILDRLTVDTGAAIVTADLEALEIRKKPDCSK